MKYKVINDSITKDGHTMFFSDIAKELNRKSFLEDESARQQTEIDKLNKALINLLEGHIELVNSGDCGSWNPETDDEVVQARQALAGDKE